MLYKVLKIIKNNFKIILYTYVVKSLLFIRHVKTKKLINTVVEWFSGSKFFKIWKNLKLKLEWVHE